jgi:hypothetical protein
VKTRVTLTIVAVALVAFACRTPDAAVPPPTAGTPGSGTVKGPLPALAPDIAARLAQLPRTKIDYDRSLLDENETRVVQLLIEASRYMDQIFVLQVSENNPQFRRLLVTGAQSSPEYRDALALFDIHKGPWDRLAHDEPFVLPAGAKPPGAAFYPADVTKEEFERWIAANPADEEAFRGLFTVIRRKGGRLVAVPYSEHYKVFLGAAAVKLREAAALTKNDSLRKYLVSRAEAFFTDDYYESDIAWMDLDSDIEVVIGPYEVYEDSLFNYKAAFESFVTVVDRPETEKLAIYEKHLPAMEQNLPIPDEHKNPSRGAESPIRVVQQIYTAGDTRAGVQTAAFNLPNDERVREAKGSKKVLLKNVMEAKFAQSGRPIGLRVLDPSQTGLVDFDAYFNYVLFHELAHGLGPGIITGPDGNRVEARLLLRETYSTIEEAKADVLGVWNIIYAMEQGLISNFTREQLFATDFGLMFRSMRFGLNEAHGRGTAIQWNWYREREAIIPVANGRFRVDMEKFPEAVRTLAHELLMIEATGDYARAQRLLESHGRGTPEIEGVIAALRDIPVDITPVYVAAGER